MDEMISSASVLSKTPGVLTNLLADRKLPIGSAWFVTSVFFTTYSTTAFLKYKQNNQKDDNNNILPTPLEEQTTTDFESRLENEISKNILPSRVQLKFLSVVTSYNRPSLLTFYRFSISLLIGMLCHPKFWLVMDRFRDTVSAVPVFIVPAFFLFFANFCNAIALDRLGISLTYVSKCGIPVVTVLIMLLLEGAQSLPNIKALCSLIPIAMGIACASWNSPFFELVGFLAAISSCVLQAGLNYTSKKAFKRMAITGPEAQRAMVAVGFLLTVGLSLSKITLEKALRMSGLKAKRKKTDAEIYEAVKKMEHPPLWLTLMAAVSYHIEYTLSFMVVRLVSPITYGTCDAIRRLSLIIAGRKMFGGEPFTKLNLVGISLALLGGLAYSVSSA